MATLLGQPGAPLPGSLQLDDLRFRCDTGV